MTCVRVRMQYAILSVCRPEMPGARSSAKRMTTRVRACVRVCVRVCVCVDRRCSSLGLCRSCSFALAYPFCPPAPPVVILFPHITSHITLQLKLFAALQSALTSSQSFSPNTLSGCHCLGLKPTLLSG